MLILSITAAWRGSWSEIRMPGTFVGMVPNGPRTWLVASGLGSHMSIWLGPPESQNKMTDFSF